MIILISYAKLSNDFSNSHAYQKEKYQEANSRKEVQHFNYEHEQRLNRQNKCTPNDYHFIGSSFGKNSIPGINEVVSHKHINSINEPSFTEMKFSEEVNLSESNDSK